MQLRLRSLIALSALSASAMSSCAHDPGVRGQSDGSPSPSLALIPCKVAGIDLPARCGTYAVPEDRSTPAGRSIGLNVAVISPSGPRQAVAPVFLLAGGPGQGATEIGAFLPQELLQLSESRDLVLVDQRGTGRSHSLACEGGFAVLEKGDPEAVRDCRTKLQQHADLRFYTTAVAADDLDEVRAALGYTQINLIAASYGTRVAQVYLRHYREHVRSMVLRGVLPMGRNILVDVPLAAQRELDRVSEQCAADPDCVRVFPRFEEELDALADRLNRAPLRLHMAHADRTRAELEVTRELLYRMIYIMLMSPETRRSIPSLVRNTAQGNLDHLRPIAAQVAASYDILPVGMYLSVVCAEDAPGVTDELRAATVFGGFAAGPLKACKRWATGEIRPRYHEPVDSEVPVLLISGGLDPATPARWGAEAARHFTNGLHVVIPNAGHLPLFPSCTVQLALQLTSTASVAELDTPCDNALPALRFLLP